MVWPPHITGLCYPDGCKQQGDHHGLAQVFRPPLPEEILAQAYCVVPTLTPGATYGLSVTCRESPVWLPWRRA
jgi:hypothetical protein